MKRLVFLTLLFVSTIIHGQRRTITGRVMNAETGEAVPHATIEIEDKRQEGKAITNHAGYFQLEIKKSVLLNISHIGYEPIQIQVPDADHFRVNLNSEVKELNYLFLSFFNGDSLPSSVFSEDQTRRTDNGTDATYIDGWQSLYTDLGELIANDDRYTGRVFEARTNFMIDENGDLQGLIVSPDTLSEVPLIEESFMKLGKWSPAQQHGNPVNQHFEWTLNSKREIFTLVDEPASFPGGIAGFYNHLLKNLRYPAEARKKKIEGKVFVQFIVEKDGSLTDVKVVKGIGGGCDEEAVRMLEGGPKWIPGKQKGKPVRQKMIQNILFKLK